MSNVEKFLENEDTNADVPRRSSRGRKRQTKPMPPVDEFADADLGETEAPQAGSMSREQRRKMARRKRAQMLRDNPFVNESETGVLPEINEKEDPEHAYLWMRVELSSDGSDRSDRSNISAKMTGRLAYDYVRMEDVPQSWRSKLHPFLLSDSTIGYRDVRLVRTSQKMRDMQVAAYEHNADKLSDQLNADTRRAIQEAGGRFQVEDDIEDREVSEL